jgi:Antitoxin Phd_YefM, type II toxin-antitoxin system
VFEMKVFTFSEARQQLSAVLDLAQSEGEVRVSRRDGRMFVIQPVQSKKSPLAIVGITTYMTNDELLGFIHESRRE